MGNHNHSNQPTTGVRLPSICQQNRRIDMINMVVLTDHRQNQRGDLLSQVSSYSSLHTLPFDP